MITIQNAIYDLVKAIEEKADALIANANQRKAELKTAIANMDAAAEDLAELNRTITELHKVYKLGAVLDNTVYHIDEMLGDMNVYETAVEKFDGYCDVCGEELSMDNEPHFIGDDEYVCESCANAVSTNEEKSE